MTKQRLLPLPLQGEGFESFSHREKVPEGRMRGKRQWLTVNHHVNSTSKKPASENSLWGDRNI
jgi:hypothetical protein